MSNPAYSGLARLVFLPGSGQWALKMQQDNDEIGASYTLVPLYLAQALRDQGIPDGTSELFLKMIPVQMDIFS